MFLTALAIVDDMGAVLIIAVFYSSGVSLAWLIAASLVLAAMFALAQTRRPPAWGFALLGVVLWYCVLHSGIHATIAGVAAAITVPIGKRRLLERMEHALAPWSAYLIVPLFGFANAGVALTGLGAEHIFAPLPLAVAAGLVLGKQAGILACVAAADRLGYAPRPEGTSWMQIWGMSLLCGIGFTMSLFITELAFPGPGSQAMLLRDEAKIGILAGSFISALGGFFVLRLAHEARARNA